MRRSVALLFALGAVACADAAQDNSPHPSVFVDRWVRLKEDNTWGDTMEFRADGTLGGSAGYQVPPNLRWEIKRDATGRAQYCATQLGAGFCRDYSIRGDTLFMLGGPQGNTTFRRVH